jgi:L-ascorbate metabolism protein UlaG (beta-lactamase superfamily)
VRSGNRASDNLVKTTYFGHSCILVEVAGKRLLFDPFISPNELARDIDVSAIQADYVLVSHGHEDHLADAEPILKRTKAKLISNFEIVSWFGQLGIENSHPMNHGGGFDFDFGRVTFVNAVHSSVMPDGSYGGNPGGFVVESLAGNFYFSGDTALTLDMKLIGESTKLDWAALCIGDNFTMGARDAAKAAEFVGASKVLGIHFDTFPPIKIDQALAKQQFADRNVELTLAKIGETIEL